MASRNKAPAFQFYPQDFIMGCAMMSAEEVGGYIRLLCYQWEHGSIPDDDTMLCRLSGCGGNAIASIRHKFGICDGGRLMNARLEQVRAEQDEYRKKQAENAAKRWSGGSKSCGGNAMGMPSHSHGNAVGMPTDMPNACPTPTPTPAINNTLRLESLTQPEGEKPSGARAPKPRERNPAIDALATVGGADISEITSSNFKQAAAALKEIRSVAPNVTAEEIARRAANYATHFPGAAVTSTAIAKHWARCAKPYQQQSGAYSTMPISNDRFQDANELFQ